MNAERMTIVGGGLAGCEAAWQVARRGVEVDLYEMRPAVSTQAHKTAMLGELVCSNSLKSDRQNTAPWLLKEELRRAGSLLLEIAREVSVPAGQALAVDRDRFARRVTEAIEREPCIHLIRQEANDIPSDGVVIIATGPLTSDALAAAIQRVTGNERLFFYDSISPIVDAETIDRSKVFAASRYGKEVDNASRGAVAVGQRADSDGDLGLQEIGGEAAAADGDYLNCPFNEAEYQRFYDALIGAESVVRHEFEELNYFEGCLPIEEIARRGRDTLRFGPMKPVGLKDLRTGRMPYAVVQLRREDLRSSSYNLVGFQNHMKFGEQKRVLQTIPGLEGAEFLRYGQIHRNTYINAPALLDPTLELRSDRRILFAGQISGVEGYVESIATGLIAGLQAVRKLRGGEASAPPRATACGSLCQYISHANPRGYQPANITFDLLPPLCGTHATIRDKKQRHALVCEIALRKFDEWLEAQESASQPIG